MLVEEILAYIYVEAYNEIYFRGMFKIMAAEALLEQYNELKKQAKEGVYRPEITTILGNIYEKSLSFLADKQHEQLTSKVTGKNYFAFKNDRKISRAINLDLYKPDYSMWERFSSAMVDDNLTGFSVEEINTLLYTIPISFVASIDLVKDGDQKTPGTFFEYYIAYFYTWRLGVEPKKEIEIHNVDSERTNLPTDFVYNLGPRLRKFHLPVKLSTRERSIMLWAHQKLLDGAYGIDRFMGTPVILAETKVDKRKKEVTEICLPAQWRVYQSYIARLKRVYYLDPPTAYCDLDTEFPSLSVKPFSEFFSEWADLSPM